MTVQIREPGENLLAAVRMVQVEEVKDRGLVDPIRT